jgi:hypothetical protein
MKPEGSLPHSQAPATCPYPKPDQSSICLPITILEDPFYITLPSTILQTNLILGKISFWICEYINIWVKSEDI